jgi:pectate lyase
MKTTMKTFTAVLVVLFLGVSLRAMTLLDDTFADGTRNNQNLPTDAAWYVSSSSSWATTAGSMSLAMGSGAILGVSYFTTNSSTPVSLAVGDTLTASIKFTFTGVAAANTSGGFRIGLFDFADSTLSPKWATADLSGNGVQGSGVQGYALFYSLGTTFGNTSPMDIRKRTTPGDSNLLGTSGDYTSLGSGPGSTNGFAGFVAGSQYLLQLSVLRSNATTLVITATWQNATNAGLTQTFSVTDTGATNFNFDGFGFRPSGSSSTATTITFNEVKVDYNGVGSPAAISLDPHDVSAYVGQSANFSIVAGGTAPLNYQWYFNTNTPVPGGTNSALTLNNLSTNDSGAYFCIVTNSFGSDTSLVATLTVTVPVAPTISAQPQNQTVYPGATANFSVAAAGSEPLSYQWYFNTNTGLVGANNSSLAINNVQATNVGTYHVVVNNLAGSITSSVALLALDNTPIAPGFVSQPASVVATAGSAVSFSASASGTAPIYYQWLKNGSAISGATGTTLTLTNVQNADAASYSLRASNSVGLAVSSAATLTISTGVLIPNSAYNLQGFASLTTGGGVIAETNSAYRKVTNALSFANALIGAYKTPGSVKVIEIMNDLDLGWNEIGTTVQTLASTPFRAHNAPQLHPRLLATGVSLIDMQPKGGLTIFSANGATIRHCCFNIKNTANVIVRNLKFDELWEWDEASKGNYDKNDWDSIDLGNGGTVTNIWLDHCTFTKNYDGIVDIKQGSSGITISWCKYTGDDGATNLNSFVWQQINSLESNRTSYAFYNFLRNNGFSTTDIVTVIQGHDKTHLIGANSLKAENASHTITLHHEWFMNPWDRLPRLRAGNVHNFNIYADDTRGLAAKRLRDTRAAAMSTANQNTLNNTYSFNPFLNGSISTESGAVLVEKSVYNDCITPLRNNQTDPANPVYTGKIMALDSIYQMDSTYFRGNSTDPGGTNTFGPVQAPIIAFSWNLPGGVLPYTATMDDPAQLPAILAAGAGAGIVNWNKTNWMLTTYAPTAPVITAQPQNLSLVPGNTATFTVIASGSANLVYQWYRNTNSLIAGATNSTFTLNSVQATNAGVYSVVVTNSAGSVTSAFATLAVASGTYARPQVGSANFSGGSLVLSVSGDAGPDYIVQVSTNLTTWDSIFTNHQPTPPFNWSDTGASNFVNRFYRILLGP